MKDVDLSEFRTAFIGEAEELLATANHALLAIENAQRRGEGYVRPLRELFRAVHTIKGLAAMVGIEPIVVVTHRLETVLRDANNGDLQLTSEAVDTLLKAVQLVGSRVQALARGADVAQPPAAMLDALEALEHGAAPAIRPPTAVVELDPFLMQKLGPSEQAQLVDGVKKGMRAVSIEFVPSADRAAQGVGITTVRTRLAALAELVKVIPRSLDVTGTAPAGLSFVIVALTTVDDAQLAAASAMAESDVHTLPIEVPMGQPPAEPVEGLEPPDRSLVRVDVVRIDDAMDRMSTLIVTRFKLQRAVRALAQTGATTRALEEILAEQGRQLRDLRAAILGLRMVKVADVLDRVPLLVRGLARATGKQVQLVTDVGHAEIDKAVAERIFPAIVHLVRNAVDHALELPAERARQSKPEKGLVRLSCSARSSTQLELVIEDDGAGVDSEAVARRSGRAVPRTDAELLELLCLPGMSTKTETTTTSGRGMGMDIVKRVVVDQLGGELSLRTRPGQGTTFSLRLPLTVAIVDAFTFESGNERYAVPVSLVEEVLEVDPAAIVRAPGALVMLGWRGHTLPLVVLSQLLGRPVSHTAKQAFVTRRNGETIAFAVDRLLGQQEVVVRPLDDVLVSVPGITGSTDLGDGRPTLVVDLQALGGREQRAAS